MAVTKRLVKGTALTHAELDGNFTDYQGFKGFFDTTVFSASNDGQLLFWNNSTSNVEVKTASTSEITEGTNLYYTDARADARADARITASGVSTAKATNWDTAYGWGNHASAGYLTNINSQGLTQLSDVDSATSGENGYILYYDHSSTSFKWKADSSSASSRFSVNTTNTSLAVNSKYAFNTTGNIITATLPATATSGDWIDIADGGFNFGTNALTIARNGNTINGASSDISLSTNGQSVGLIYNGSGWVTYIGLNTAIYG
tara:strand:+ start:624 stop:1406 length:783 start_codon:yes stop_codon:yes gene_type:complete